VATQGNYHSNHWVRAFTLKYGMNIDYLRNYKEAGLLKVGMMMMILMVIMMIILKMMMMMMMIMMMILMMIIILMMMILMVMMMFVVLMMNGDDEMVISNDNDYNKYDNDKVDHCFLFFFRCSWPTMIVILLFTTQSITSGQDMFALGQNPGMDISQ